MMKKDVDVLLMNPPFGTVMNPYISIPVLAAYLKSRGIHTKAYDANQEFLYRFVTLENIRKGKEFVKNRFCELNTREELSFSEIFEYAFLFNIVKEMEIDQQKLSKLYLPFSDFSDLQESKVKNLAIRLASVPNFPEMFITQPHFIYSSPFDVFSSEDIIQSTNTDSIYNEILGEIIAEVMSAYNPTVVGLSLTYNNQVLPAFYCAHMIKRINPATHVTLGGTFITIHMRSLKNETLFKCVDSFVLDEGEIPLENLFRELAKKNGKLENVPGLVYPVNGSIRYNPSAPPVSLEQLPPPDYSVFDLDRYLLPRQDLMVPFRLSKGCYWRKCAFCRTDLSFCRNFEQPPFEFVYQQLKHVILTFGLKNFVFSDESANPVLL
ncbi:MAG: cobalamin-dependent protein, partial [Deltaproteobacteria bacterium]|nr:cobalamin-dependent protein [Deltaproteobacteria bacterium]